VNAYVLLDGVATYCTVRVTGLLVALPTALLTTTVRIAPFSAADTAVIVKYGLVLPAMLSPFCCHW
jgi:hypothetical protein